MKTFTKYLSLTILLLLGVCCIGVLYLFFVPGSSLFNIKYISYHQDYSKEYSPTDINTVSVNSRSYDVKITSTDSEKIIVKLYTNSFGFVLVKNSEANISSTTKDNILTLNITEPYGFATPNSSYVEVRLPKDQTFNLTLNNKKASTYINDENLKLKNFSYTTENGDLNLTNANISGNLNLELNKATCQVAEAVALNNSNLKLSLTSGKFYANSSTFKDITIAKNERGVIEFKESAQLLEDVSSAGGRIKAETIAHINVKSSATNIYIDNVTSGALIVLDSGDIEIGSLTGSSSSLTTESGNIKINNVYSQISAITNDGNINISNARMPINTSTKYGNININFSEEAPNSTSARYINATLKDGKLIATGLVKISAIITGNGRLELDMQDVLEDSSITGNSGSVYVKVNKDSVYKLTTEAEGSVRVNLTQIPNYNGYTTTEKTITYVNCYEADNTLNSLNIKTTTGSLLVLDTNFA